MDVDDAKVENLANGSVVKDIEGEEEKEEGDGVQNEEEEEEEEEGEGEYEVEAIMDHRQKSVSGLQMTLHVLTTPCTSLAHDPHFHKCTRFLSTYTTRYFS